MSDDADRLVGLPTNLRLEVNDRPLQFPGRARHVRRALTGGPDQPGDRRILLSVDVLERCLAAARASPLRRAVIGRAGVQVDLYEQTNGHRFEVWSVIGIAPVPEQIPAAVSQLTATGRRE